MKEIFGFFAKYEDDFVLDNSSIVRNQKGEIFAKLNSNFSVSEMIDLSGTDAGDCTEISSVGSVEDAYYAIVHDAMGAIIGPVTYTSSGGSIPAIVEFGEDMDGDMM